MEEFFRKNKSEREYLCRYYDIQIVRRYRLIPGQKFRGLYKDIKDLIYEFKAQNKRYPSNKPFFFHTGKPSGDEFIRFANIMNVPPVFNLLEDVFQVVDRNNNQEQQPHQNHMQVDFDPRNREMLTILNIFFYVERLDVDLPAFKIYEKIITNPIDFQPSLLRGINTIICHGFGLNLASFMEKTEAKLLEYNIQQNLANFSFNHLIRYCEDHPLPEPSFF